jgi:hypothetical protein
MAITVALGAVANQVAIGSARFANVVSVCTPCREMTSFALDTSTPYTALL